MLPGVESRRGPFVDDLPELITDHVEAGEGASGAEGGDVRWGRRQHRYHCTRTALEQSGLLELTLRMSAVIRTLRSYEAEVRALRRESHAFLLTVINAPENARFKEHLLHCLLANFKAKLRERQNQDD
jgi:hypothetical protein